MYDIPPKRLTIVHQSFCTSQIWWTKISWISSRSENTGRCISCYHPTCWWLTPLLLTSLTVSILLAGVSAHVWPKFVSVCVYNIRRSKVLHSREILCAYQSVLWCSKSCVIWCFSEIQKQHLKLFSEHVAPRSSLFIYIEHFAELLSKVYWIADYCVSMISLLANNRS